MVLMVVIDNHNVEGHSESEGGGLFRSMIGTTVNSERQKLLDLGRTEGQGSAAAPSPSHDLPGFSLTSPAPGEFPTSFSPSLCVRCLLRCAKGGLLGTELVRERKNESKREKKFGLWPLGTADWVTGGVLPKGEADIFLELGMSIDVLDDRPVMEVVLERGLAIFPADEPPDME